MFDKATEMPCPPPVGTIVTFQGVTFSQTVKQLSYDEDSGCFAAYYELDVLEEQDRLQDFITDDFFPKKFVQQGGFTARWLEDEYENMFEE
jgi:hypothetical protein